MDKRPIVDLGFAVRAGLGALLACAVAGSGAADQAVSPSSGTATAAAKPATASGKPAATAKADAPAPRPLPNRFAGRAGTYYRVYWGIDHLAVKEGESGQIIRFSWRVVDPERAAMLNDKKLEPSLIAPQAGVSLVVPVLDKIGQMRQTTPPEAGRTYWMAFSNKGHHVKRGDRVNVVVGTFRAEGLMVD